MSRRRAEEPGRAEGAGGRQREAAEGEIGEGKAEGDKLLIPCCGKRHSTGSPGGNWAEAHTPWSVRRTAGSPGSGDVTCS